MTIDPKLTGDPAKLSIKDDLFGLDKITENLAAVFLDRVSANGYCIGIEGQWGEGKSSLTNFIAEKIAKEGLARHSIIRFEPWLVSSKKELLRAFFSLLISEIKQLGDIPSLANKLNASEPGIISKTISQLSSYMVALQQGIDGLEYASAFDPSGKSKVAVLILKFLAWIAKLFSKSVPTLEQAKANVRDDLQIIANILPDFRITVIVDDLDRLEPAESVELLRVIRAVADFPAVTYLICFDRSTLAKHIKTVLKVDGYDFMEKIFQNFVTLPPQEPFALRRYVRKLLSDAFPEEFLSAGEDLQRQERRQILFDQWIGNFIHTPRDAIRLCEAIKLGWPYLRGRADFEDYIWLQLLKLQCKDLYEWTKKYVVSLGSYRDSGRPSEDEPSRKGKELANIMEKVGALPNRDNFGVSYFLPGVSGYTAPTKGAVFTFENDDELSSFEKKQRLGSPSHWRLYFSFDLPSYALDDGSLAVFKKLLVDDHHQAANFLRLLADRQHEQRGFYLSVFLERLFDNKEDLTKQAKLGLVKAFAEMMDEVPETTDEAFNFSGAWRRATTFFDKDISVEFLEVVRSAPSINWLATVVRDQGFARGIPEGDRRHPERYWLTDVQFDNARVSVVGRLRQMGLRKVLMLPRPIHALYCWLQLGPAGELKELIQIETAESRIFLDLIAALRTWVSSSDRGIERRIGRENVANFMDPEMAKQRLEELSKVEEADIRTRAQEYLAQWESH